MANPILIVAADGTPVTYSGAFVIWGYSSGPLLRRRRRAVTHMEVGMTSYTAAAELVRRVADFSQRQPEWADCIIYMTRPDERWDLTLVSQRVYGNRDEALVVMAAAGLDTVEQELREARLVLPTATQLARIKAQCGFVGDRWNRAPETAADSVGGR